jgi:hypothetical protein
MTSTLKISLLCASLLLASPGLAQTDAHAEHHPAAPAPTAVVSAAPAMMRECHRRMMRHGRLAPAHKRHHRLQTPPLQAGWRHR